MKSFNCRLGRQEKVEQEQSEIKVKWIDTYFLCIGGYRIVVMHIYSTKRWYVEEQDNNERLCGFMIWWETVPWRIWQKGTALTLQRYVICWCRCKKDNKRVQWRETLTFVKEDNRLTWLPTVTHLWWGSPISDHPMSEFVRIAQQASAALVRLSLWPLFCPHGQGTCLFTTVSKCLAHKMDAQYIVGEALMSIS